MIKFYTLLIFFSDEAVVAPVVPPVAEAAAIPEDMDVSTALELTVRKSRAYGGVVRGLHESAKLIEKRVAQLCVLAEDCNQPDYVKLVKALCADHSIKLLTVPSAKTLGEWAGVSSFPFIWLKLSPLRKSVGIHNLEFGCSFARLIQREMRGRLLDAHVL